jgi:hypothetical protein
LPIDAIVCMEPWSQRLSQLRPIYDSSRMGSAVVRVLAAHVDALEEHRDELKGLVHAHHQWVGRLREGGQGLEPVLRREGVTQAEFRRILEKVEMPSLEQSRLWLRGQDDWLSAQLLRLQEELPVQETSDKDSITPESLFYPTVLEEMP